MATTDDATARTGALSRGTTAEERAEDADEPPDIEGPPLSSIEPIGATGESRRQPLGERTLADENERRRLIAEIARLIREPAVPPNMRIAGLTLIGWLARRLPDERPHALGVQEALESERRTRASRMKTR